MKSITANFVPAIILIRNRVQIGSFGQGLMKRRIEDRDLRKARTEEIPGGLNAFYVSRVVRGASSMQSRSRKSFAVINEMGESPHLRAPRDDPPVMAAML